MKSLKRNMKAGLILMAVGAGLLAYSEIDRCQEEIDYEEIYYEYTGNESPGQAELNVHLLTAVVAGDTDEVYRFLKLGANVNARGGFHYLKTIDSVMSNQPALHIASWHGHTETVQLLIDNGANVNARDDRGLTALNKAIRNKHPEVIEILVDAGGIKKKKPLWDNLFSESPYMVVKGIVSRIVQH